MELYKVDQSKGANINTTRGLKFSSSNKSKSDLKHSNDIWVYRQRREMAVDVLFALFHANGIIFGTKLNIYMWMSSNLHTVVIRNFPTGVWMALELTIFWNGIAIRRTKVNTLSYTLRLVLVLIEWRFDLQEAVQCKLIIWTIIKPMRTKAEWILCWKTKHINVIWELLCKLYYDTDIDSECVHAYSYNYCILYYITLYHIKW